MKKIAFAAAVIMGTLSLAAQNYDMKRALPVDGAVIENEILKLDGKTGYAILPGTENISINAGMTVACLVKANDNATKGDGNAIMDTYISKGKNFILCRWGSQISTRTLDKTTGKYVILRGRPIPRKDVWTHLAATSEKNADGLSVKIYVNGKLIASTVHPNAQGLEKKVPLELGKGWGGQWMLNGEIRDVYCTGKVLSDAEIAALATKK